MKKINRKMRLLRPADGFLPLAFLVAAVLGHSTAAEQTFINMLFPALFALASARGLRLAFAEQPSMRRVAGSVKLALPLQLVGALAFFVVDLLRNQGRIVTVNQVLCMVLTGICLAWMLYSRQRKGQTFNIAHRKR